jgi:hypothetical protein
MLENTAQPDKDFVRSPYNVLDFALDRGRDEPQYLPKDYNQVRRPHEEPN